jgi:hypothetical protein
MRTAPRTALSFGHRALLALLLAGAFGFRVVASPAAWGCMTAEHAAHGSGQPAGHEHGHPQHGPGLPACECLAHAAGAGLAVRPLELAASYLLPAQSAAGPSGQGVRIATSSSHLLPFSVGPPSLLAV